MSLTVFYDLSSVYVIAVYMYITLLLKINSQRFENVRKAYFVFTRKSALVLHIHSMGLFELVTYLSQDICV